MPRLVPNELPSLDLPYKIAVIGEAPGADEEAIGKPFVGASGRFLSAILSSCSILRHGCLVGNICQLRPPNNDIKQFDWMDDEIQSGLQQLKADIINADPNICLLLGATPLKAAGVKHSISDYRGTLFTCFDTDSPFFGRKCLATYHPAFVLRDYSAAPLFAFDIQRAKLHSTSPILTPPERSYEISLSCSEICQRLDTIDSSCLVSIDIEGGIEQGVTCVGVSCNHQVGFIISLGNYSSSEQIEIIRKLARVLSSPQISKVLQNSLYDNFVLSWLWKLPIRNVLHDTMLSGWEIYPELPKALGVQTSIWTEEPFYKFERKIDDKSTHFTYCIKDALVTHEISQRHTEVLSGSSLEHYQFNTSLLPALLYMELRGIKYAADRAKSRLEEIQIEQAEIQTRIDQAAGIPLNVNSPKQMIEALYSRLGYEPQYTKEHGKKTTKKTADVEALLTLSRQYDSPLILDILKWRALDGQRKQLALESDKDGRIRCSYNLVGTDTGRLSCSESPLGTGTNLQTIMRKNRDLYVADEGKYFFKCDLSGADGWTVAAHSLRLGDPTMMDDLLFGMKVAKILAVMQVHGPSVSKLSRPDLKQLIADTEASMGEHKWGGLYEACKVAQHGCYTESHQLLTREGWKSIKDITQFDAVMVYDKQTRTSHWEYPQRTVAFPYTGTLHKFVGTAIDLEVTHDHKMLLETNGTYKELEAQEVTNRKSGRMPYSTRYSTGIIDEPYARLIAAFQSDGCLTKDNYIVFHFVKLRKVVRLTDLLNEFEIPFSLCQNKDETYHFGITDAWWVKELSKWSKDATHEMLEWNFDSLNNYIDEYPHWDGYFPPNGGADIFSVKRDHLAWIGTFAVLTGRGYTWSAPAISGFGSTVHCIKLNNRAFADRNSLKDTSVTEVENQMVYCVTVPSGYLLVRNNEKICISGNSSYMMGKNTGSVNLLKKTYKETGTPIYYAPKEIDALQKLFFLRYRGIADWQRDVGKMLETSRQLTGHSTITAASGHTRTFFGRPGDNETLKAALAHEPQANTTYAIKLALYNLWTDPENLNLDGSYIIEPLHTVHDELDGQFPLDRTEWAIDKIKQYFRNELTIANHELVIPFGFAYGPSWGELPHKVS